MQVPAHDAAADQRRTRLILGVRPSQKNECYGDRIEYCCSPDSNIGKVADEYAGKLKIAKLNIDQNEATAPKFGIRSIPTLILFKNGNAEATKIGAMSKSELTAFIEQAL